MQITVPITVPLATFILGIMPDVPDSVFNLDDTVLFDLIFLSLILWTVWRRFHASLHGLYNLGNLPIVGRQTAGSNPGMALGLGQAMNAYAGPVLHVLFQDCRLLFSWFPDIEQQHCCGHHSFPVAVMTFFLFFFYDIFSWIFFLY